MALAAIAVSILFSVFAAIRPFKIGWVPMTMATVPPIALGVLVVLGIVNFETLQLGIFGNGKLVPWEIIVIFFTVAYVSISVDVTGIFDYFAYKIVRAARQSGILLFIFFYLFASVLTVFTSNDIVILTLTPIIFYLSKHANVNVIPLLFAEFFGANTLSMLLYIGNPTNIIVGNALGLGFLEYTSVMWLPTLVAAVTSLLLLWLIFRKDMTRRFILNSHSEFYVRNWVDAVLSLVLLVLMLVALLFSQQIGLPIWFITSFFCLLLIVEDVLFGVYYFFHNSEASDAQRQKGEDVYRIPKEKNELWIALTRMPWKILPFILSFFIFVHALDQYGAINQIASILAQYSTTLGSGIVLNGVLAFIVANIVNNQPMTIFYSSILVSDTFTVSETVLSGSAYAVVIASNLGANVTLIGALAGLMWSEILGTKGVRVAYLDFLKIGLAITPLVCALTLGTLYLVLA